MVARLKNKTKSAHVKDSESLTIWGWGVVLYFAFRPLYFFSSGGLQVADYLIVAFFVILFAKRGIVETPQGIGRTIAFHFIPYIVWVLVINVIWFFIYSASAPADYRFLISCLYPLFNFMSVLTCVMLYQSLGTRFFRSVGIGLLFTSIIVFITILINTAGVGRNSGGFNNPNQLGYYSVLVFIASLIVSKYLKNWQLAIILALSLFAVIISQSKAAIISIAASLVFILLFTNPFGIKLKSWIRVGLSVLLILSLFILFTDTTLFNDNELVSVLKRRLMNFAEENDSDLGSGRGYNRLSEIGINIVWGVGEGGYDRFVTLSGHEIHSSYVGILCSYGIIGFFLMFSIIYSMLFSKSGNKLNTLFLFSAVFLYWVSHQGLRTTTVWIVFAVYFLMCIHSDDEVA